MNTASAPMAPNQEVTTPRADLPVSAISAETGALRLAVSGSPRVHLG